MKDSHYSSKLYHTLHKLGIVEIEQTWGKLYITDEGDVLSVSPDGATSIMGKMSLTGELICKTRA